MTPQAFHDATQAVLTSLREGAAALPADSGLAARVNSYAAAAKQVGLGRGVALHFGLSAIASPRAAASICVCCSIQALTC